MKWVINAKAEPVKIVYVHSSIIVKLKVLAVLDQVCQMVIAQVVQLDPLSVQPVELMAKVVLRGLLTFVNLVTAALTISVVNLLARVVLWVIRLTQINRPSVPPTPPDPLVTMVQLWRLELVVSMNVVTRVLVCQQPLTLVLKTVSLEPMAKSTVR